ncbi:hypothetical protein KC331_g20376, partial [Hortaea werneckii]
MVREVRGIDVTVVETITSVVELSVCVDVTVCEATAAGEEAEAEEYVVSLTDVVVRLEISGPPVGPLVSEESTDWVVSGLEEELDDEVELVSTLELDVEPGKSEMMVDVVSVEVCVWGSPREEADDEAKLVSTLSLDVKPGVAGSLVDVVSVESCVPGPPSEEADGEAKLVSTVAPDVKPGVIVV